IENDEGEMEDTIKISGNTEKVTTPGRKKVYRIIDRENGKSEGDYITMYDEDPAQEDHLKMFHPVHTYVSKFVSNFDAVNIHQQVIRSGEVVYEMPPLADIQAYSK